MSEGIYTTSQEGKTTRNMAAAAVQFFMLRPFPPVGETLNDINEHEIFITNS